jgi:ketosteroid isomerase-like protein
MSHPNKSSSLEKLESLASGDLLGKARVGGSPPPPGQDEAMRRRLAQLRTAMGDAPSQAPQANAVDPVVTVERERSSTLDATAEPDMLAMPNLLAEPDPVTAPFATEDLDKGRRWPAVLLLGAGAVTAAWAMWATQPSPPPAAPQATAVAPHVVAAHEPSAQPVPTSPAAAKTAVPAQAPSVAQAEASAPEPAKASAVPLDEQVKDTVEAWRQAWASRDMMAYLDFYGEAFAPADGMSRGDWIASRYRNVGGRKAIEVQIKDVQVVPLGDDRARVSFLQDYASGGYRETAQTKTLELQRGPDGRWRILGEWQGEPPAPIETGKS